MPSTNVWFYLNKNRLCSSMKGVSWSRLHYDTLLCPRAWYMSTMCIDYMIHSRHINSGDPLTYRSLWSLLFFHFLFQLQVFWHLPDILFPSDLIFFQFITMLLAHFPSISNPSQHMMFLTISWYYMISITIYYICPRKALSRIDLNVYLLFSNTADRKPISHKQWDVLLAQINGS